MYLLFVANVPGYGKQGVKGSVGSGCQVANPDSYREAGLNAPAILS
jgi:hypothetical protein